ncbi:MAG: hypothetical protein JXN60_00515 [Lentisphaerae bacterium]|nr:hypothetical protein [Lentisphaerota bacterium]
MEQWNFIIRRMLTGLLCAFAVLALVQWGNGAEDIGSQADLPEVRVSTKRLSDYDLPGFREKVYLNTMEAWDVVQVIEFLAHKGGLNNVVIGKGVAGLTTKLKFDGVAIGDALEIVLSVNSLAYEVKGGIVTIMTDAEYKTLYGTSFYDHKKVRIVDLKYADASHVAGMLASVKSDIGTIVADPVTGTLILIDTPEKIREMLMVANRADMETVSRVLPTETKTFVIQYGDVTDIHQEVTKLLSKDGGSAIADVRTKTLVVTDLPHAIRKIEQIVTLFDKRPQQVFIEAKIIEVALDDAHSLGINWQHLLSGTGPRFSLQALSAPLSAKSAIGSVGRLTYNTVALGGDLEVIVDALRTVGKTIIHSNPQIAVMDGQEAVIEVVEDQPYKEIALESGTTNITGVTYLFKKVGVQLSVTPKINDENFVSVAVRPEISSISQWYDGGAQQGTPVIKKAFAETTVMVKDGVTIIIGGMIRDRKDTSMSSIPLLGSIPVLGRLFRHDTDTIVKTETVVFMTPRIISGEAPVKLLRDIEKSPKPLRPVGQDQIYKELKPIR